LLQIDAYDIATGEETSPEEPPIPDDNIPAEVRAYDRFERDLDRFDNRSRMAVGLITSSLLLGSDTLDKATAVLEMGNDLPRIWAYVQSGFIIATPEKRDEIKRLFENVSQGATETIAQIATRIIVLNAQFMVLNDGIGFEERERVKVFVSNTNSNFSTIRILVKDKIETIENDIQQHDANGDAIARLIYPWDQAVRAFEKYEQDELPKLKRTNNRAEPKASAGEIDQDNVLLTRRE
jgi:hypothetical protein